MAVAQQLKIRRAFMREIADYTSNAEARAYAEEAEPRGERPGRRLPIVVSHARRSPDPGDAPTTHGGDDRRAVLTARRRSRW